MLISFIGDDQAESFFNKEVNEAYHSKVGPLIEARYKFVEPSCIKELLLNKRNIKILDLFFGLGYNSGVAIDYVYNFCQANHIDPVPKFEITGIEKDLKIIEKIKELKVPAWYRKWQLILSKLEVEQSITIENITLTMFLDDVWNIINTLPKSCYDVIFFDPFSHKSTPEFWTNEFLSLALTLLAPNGTLTTYSGLKRVKKLAEDTGFKVAYTAPIGRKKPSLMIKAS